MKHTKILGLVLVAAMAMMAFAAASASATELYSSGATYKGAIKATLTGGTAKLTSTSGTLLDTCTGGEVAGNIESQGGAGVPAKGKITALTWTGCTEPTTTATNGELEINHIAGTTNGTVTGKNSVVNVNTTIFGATCEYTVGAGLDLGNLAGSKTKNATLIVDTIVPAKNSFFCPDARWEADYAVTNPTNLYVEAS